MAVDAFVATAVSVGLLALAAATVRVLVARATDFWWVAAVSIRQSVKGLCRAVV